MDKKEIAHIFEEIALFLEIKGANPFRVRAYRNGARALLNFDGDLDELIRQGKLTELEGIGKDLAEKITHLAKKGRLPFYERLKKSIPKQLLELNTVRGLGPKKIKILYGKLKIQSLSALKKACIQGKLSKIKGFGKKTEKNILDSLSSLEKYKSRHLWWDGMEIAEPLLIELKNLKAVIKADIAGSLRRGTETVGDLDFVVASSEPHPIGRWFVEHPNVIKVLSEGETRFSVLLKSGMQADLRIVSEKDYPFALCYFTGSQPHTVKLREKSRTLGWSMSEYGFKPIGRKRTALPKITDEAGLYKALGYCFIPPELRENLGEFEAAEKGKIPHLIEESDIRGTFHNHTSASDGENTLKEMVQAAENLGWEYIGISDHSKSSIQANGLSVDRLELQIEEIEQMNKSRKFKIHIFAGSECDILPDGSLDYPDKLLKKLDFVIASVHSSFSQDEKTMTKRIVRALEHPFTTMLGHATGRLLLRREPYQVNMGKIIDAAIANKKIIEINGTPERLDMDWRLWRKAIEKGLLCCINTDAHSIHEHRYIRSGINTARKGWLEKSNALNTRPLNLIKKYLSLIV